MSKKSCNWRVKQGVPVRFEDRVQIDRLATFERSPREWWRCGIARGGDIGRRFWRMPTAARTFGLIVLLDGVEDPKSRSDHSNALTAGAHVRGDSERRARDLQTPLPRGSGSAGASTGCESDESSCVHHGNS